MFLCVLIVHTVPRYQQLFILVLKRRVVILLLFAAE
jgi:hypothetical protein